MLDLKNILIFFQKMIKNNYVGVGFVKRIYKTFFKITMVIFITLVVLEVDAFAADIPGLNLTIGAGAATMGLNGSGYATAPDLTFGGAGGSATAGVAVLSASQGSGINHAGWQLRTQGQGGRAGRVRWETLVAMSSISGDATDDTVLPE